MFRKLFLVPAVSAALLAAFLAISLAPFSPAFAQQAGGRTAAFTAEQRAEIVEIIRGALKRDPSILRDAVIALQADEAARQQNSAQAAIAGAGAQLTASSVDQVEGNPSGDVTVVEFYDPRCPYCRRMLPVESEILKRDPRLRWVFKEIPVLGPASVLGTRAILAAQKQGRYEAMHEALMLGTPDITQSVIHAAADARGLDWPRLERDMNGADVQARIEVNLALARKLQIDGTPAFVIGSKVAPGAVDLATLQAMVADARGR